MKFGFWITFDLSPFLPFPPSSPLKHFYAGKRLPSLLRKTTPHLQLHLHSFSIVLLLWLEHEKKLLLYENLAMILL